MALSAKVSSTLDALALMAVLFVADDASALAQSAEVPNLLYHQISAPLYPLPTDDMTVDIRSFSEQMKYLHDHGYQTVSSSELVRRLRSGENLPVNAVLIHFDDGWRSVLAAVPVLEHYHFGATFWLIVEMIGQPGYLGWDELVKLATNPDFEFQSHTMSHSDLLVLATSNLTKDQNQIQWELEESKHELEYKFKRKINLLAWPKGAYDDRLIESAVKAGYSGLFTVEWGLSKNGQDPLRIPRSYVGGPCDLGAFRQILADGHSRQCRELSLHMER